MLTFRYGALSLHIYTSLCILLHVPSQIVRYIDTKLDIDLHPVCLTPMYGKSSSWRQDCKCTCTTAGWSETCACNACGHSWHALHSVGFSTLNKGLSGKISCYLIEGVGKMTPHVMLSIRGLLLLLIIRGGVAVYLTKVRKQVEMIYQMGPLRPCEFASRRYFVQTNVLLFYNIALLKTPLLSFYTVVFDCPLQLQPLMIMMCRRCKKRVS